jgi:hypothetical protein
MIHITSPYFCAGGAAQRHRGPCGPDLELHMFGWTGERVLAYARRRGGQTDISDEAA